MIIAGTGHRPDKLGGYSDVVHDRLVTLASDMLVAMRPEKVISGMALGWDQALAKAAIISDIPFVAAVPFVNQQAKWPQQAQNYYAWLAKHAAEFIVASEGGYAAYKMQVRNKWMVDHCDAVLALHNGSEGGTFNCLKYAEARGKPIVNCWERYVNMIAKEKA